MVKKILWAFILLLIFLGLMYIFSQGLKRDQQQMPSALLDKPLPDFSLTDLYDEHKIETKKSILSEIALINVWASWCPPCATEHELIVELADEGVIIYGLNYQDDRTAAQLWLKERGDPYKNVFFDGQGSVGIDWGVIAVPETFLIDAQGIVRYRHIGALTRDIWQNNFLPMIQQLKLHAVSPYVFNNGHDEARFYQLTGQLRCVVCQNQTLLDSDAQLAKNLREQVYEQILQGKSNEEILDYLTTRYGDFILYQPPVNANTWLLWFGPGILLLIAGIILIVIIRRAHHQYKGEK